MQIDVTTQSSTDPVPAGTPDGEGVNAPDLRWFVFGLFFAFGGITSLNDVLIPKLKDIFMLGYGQALLVQSAFFGAYFLFSMPAAGIVRRFGYLRTALVGVLVMTAGCLLFIPASSSGIFGLFLVALFVLAGGVTIVQVVANPLISLLGPQRTAPSRLTFAQAFNSLGTTVFPYVGAVLILGSLATVDVTTLEGAALDAYRTAETRVVVQTYLGLAAALLVIAVLLWVRRDRLPKEEVVEGSLRQSFTLLRRPRFAMGAVCLFLYVGAEVAIGSLIVNYLMMTETLGLDAEAAGKHVAFYWGGALVGRFVGALLLRFVSPSKVLAAAAMGSIILILISANSMGLLSGWSLLAVGLMNAVMFPTIFSLACAGLGPRAAEGSGLLCMAIVGGAIIPPLAGMLADGAGLHLAMIVPALCYVAITGYGLYLTALTAAEASPNAPASAG